MSKRVQIVVADAELRRFRELASASGLSLSEWALVVLRRAATGGAPADQERKLAALRTATAHQVPAGEIDRMLAELE